MGWAFGTFVRSFVFRVSSKCSLFVFVVIIMGCRWFFLKNQSMISIVFTFFVIFFSVPYYLIEFDFVFRNVIIKFLLSSTCECSKFWLRQFSLLFLYVAFERVKIFCRPSNFCYQLKNYIRNAKHNFKSLAKSRELKVQRAHIFVKLSRKIENLVRQHAT